MDKEQVSLVDPGKLPVNGKFVVVFAEGPDHVIGVIADLVLFAQDSDMVIGAVHGGAHEVGRAGVDADIFLVNMLGVDRPGHESTVGGEHEAAHLGIDRDISHSRGDEDALVFFPHSLSDHTNIIGDLALAVGDSYAAGEIDEGKVDAEFPLCLCRQAEKSSGQFRVIVIGDRIAGEESVQAEVLHSLVPEDPVAFEELSLGKAVFGIAGIVHDPVAHLEDAAGIVAQGHGLRELPVQDLFKEGDVGDVIEVDDGAQLRRKGVLLSGSVVGGKHDLMSRGPHGIRQHQLRH